jgi:hypothetical protein
MAGVLEVADKNIRKFSTKYSTDEIWMVLDFGYLNCEF